MVLTPFLFYLYKYAPATETWDIGSITIESGRFRTIVGLAHAFFTKTTFLLLTTIWFFTSNQWWRYAILVPFTMFLFQLSGVINDKVQFIDDYDFWYSLPIIIPIISLMIFISIKLNKQAKLLDLREQITQEMNTIQEKRRAS